MHLLTIIRVHCFAKNNMGIYQEKCKLLLIQLHQLFENGQEEQKMDP